MSKCNANSNNSVPGPPSSIDLFITFHYIIVNLLTVATYSTTNINWTYLF